MGWGNNSLGDAGYLAPIMQQINRTGDIMQYGDQSRRQEDLLNMQKQKNAFEMQVQGLQMEAAKQAQVEKVRHQNAFSQAYQTADPMKDPEGFARLYIQNNGNPEVAMKLMEDAQKGYVKLGENESLYNPRSGSVVAQGGGSGLTGDAKNLDILSRDPAKMEAYLAQKERLARAAAPNIDLRNLLGRETSIGETRLKKLDESETNAVQARSSMGRIKEILGIVNQHGNDVVGWDGAFRAALAPIAKNIGMDVEKANAAQLLSLMLKTGAGGLRMEVVGPGPVANYETQILQEVSGGKLSAAAGLKKLMEYHYKNNQSKIDKFNRDVENLSSLKGYESAKTVFPKIDYGDVSITPSEKTAVRTGTMNGRKVVEYSDGSIDYAD